MSSELLPIGSGEKFGVIALYQAWRRDDLAQPTRLGDDLWVLPQAPLEMQSHWQTWVGSIRAGAISSANLWIVAKALSTRPRVLDNENKRLCARVKRLFYATLLVAPVCYEQGFILSGANVEGAPEVRQFSDLHPFLVSEGVSCASVGTAEVQRAFRVAQGLEVIFANPGYMRVRAGIFVFLRGLQRDDLDGRLHQFVRALEGVVKPEIGRTRKQFVDRCQTFTGRSPAHAAVLEESYNIRSRVEHLHDWQLALANVPEAQREERLASDQRKIEALCRHVYGWICESVTHRDCFRDNAIDGFWNRPGCERQQLWSTQLNLETIS